jgi:nitroreductase
MTLAENETIRIILGRRSVRAFEPKNVEREKVDLLLECAFAAPSAKNIQPCHLVVIDDKGLLTKIGAANPRAKMVGGAPLAVAVCVDVANYETEHGLTDGTWMEDSSCVMENILLAARALELEGVWLQIANRPEREETVPPLLSLPEGVRLFALAVLGYGAEKKTPHSGIPEARLHRNIW